jgi:acetyl-CoA carboxylase biotin carboxyl carrier protein
MTFKEIKELISLVSESAIKEFQIKNGEFEVLIRTDKDTDAPIMGSHTMASSHPTMVSQAMPQAVPSIVDADLPPVKEVVASTAHLIEVKSPMVGTFYRSPAPEKPVYVQIGDSINAGSVVCVIEAMKLFNEIESEVSGKIVKVLVDDASPVEYDQVLFLIDPNA